VSPVGVTVSRGCAVCGADLSGRRPQTRTCSSACRQALYRHRLQQTVTGISSSSGPVYLTPALRDWLRLEIDRRQRRRIAEREAA
jgi:hypothetical protein